MISPVPKAGTPASLIYGEKIVRRAQIMDIEAIRELAGSTAAMPRWSHADYSTYCVAERQGGLSQRKAIFVACIPKLDRKELTNSDETSADGWWTIVGFAAFSAVIVSDAGNVNSKILPWTSGGGGRGWRSVCWAPVCYGAVPGARQIDSIGPMSTRSAGCNWKCGLPMWVLWRFIKRLVFRRLGAGRIITRTRRRMRFACAERWTAPPQAVENFSKKVVDLCARFAVL